MNDIAMKIISIDVATVNMKARYADLIEKKEAELRDNIQKLEKRYSIESIEEADRIYNEIVNQSDYKIKESKTVTNFKGIDNTYNKLKGNLIENLWNDIFSGKE